MAAFINDTRDAHESLHVLVQQQTSLNPNILNQFPSQKVLRTFQLDALQCESELTAILTNMLNNILSVGPLEMIRFRNQEELSLGLQLVLYKFAVWDRDQSVWDRLQNLVYRNERALEAHYSSHVGGSTAGPLAVVASQRFAPTRLQKTIHLVLSVIIPYLYKKLVHKSLEENWGADEEAGATNHSWKWYAVRLLKWSSTLWNGLSLLHTLTFFVEGKYRSVVDRLVGMRLVYGDQKMRRLVNLMYLNQHVSWQSWSSFLNVLLPLLQVGKWWQSVTSLSGSFFTSVTSSGATGGVEGLREGYCCACKEVAVLGRRSNCGHLYCHYCIAQRLEPTTQGEEERRTFPCYRCGAVVTSMRL